MYFVVNQEFGRVWMLLLLLQVHGHLLTLLEVWASMWFTVASKRTHAHLQDLGCFFGPLWYRLPCKTLDKDMFIKP